MLSCIAARECHHRNSVKQIWGPPGTGKTKTVATLLFALHRMKCRTLTCAPTNIAVLAVTKRLVGLVRDSNEDGTYRLGDIVLFGNYKRMKIKDHGDLCEVFLDVRLKILAKCFHWHTGWKKSLDSMICLLEEPKEMYSKYLREGMIQGEGKEVQTNQENEEDKQSQSFNKDRSKLIQGPMGVQANQEKEGNQSQSFNKDRGKSEKRWTRKDIEQTLKNNEKGKKQQDKNGKGATDRSPEKVLKLEEFFKKKFDDIVGNQEKEGNQSQSFNKDRGKSEKRWMRKDIEQTLKNNEKGKKQLDKNGKGATDRSPEKVLTLEEFFKKKFYDIVGNLKFCIPMLLKHLPTSLITLEVANNMIAAQSLLESLTTLLRSAVEASTALKEVIDEIGIAGKIVGRFCKFHVTRIKLIGKLRCLQTIEVPNTTLLKSYCLRNATLLFCTASSSAKIPEAEKPIELLIIDEAAQLKECESAIPLQIPGIRHAILIGDELQLPAMVISKVWNLTCFCCFMLINYDMFFTVWYLKHLLNWIRFLRKPNLEEVCSRGWCC